MLYGCTCSNEQEHPSKKSQTINLGDTASPHIGSGDPDERAQKARTTIGRQA